MTCFTGFNLVAALFTSTTTFASLFQLTSKLRFFTKKRLVKIKQFKLVNKKYLVLYSVYKMIILCKRKIKINLKIKSIKKAANKARASIT